MQSLDRGGEVDPQEERRAEQADNQHGEAGPGQRAIGLRIDDLEKVLDLGAERGGTAEPLADSQRQPAQEYHPAQDDQPREPVLGAIDAALEAEQVPEDPIHAKSSGRRKAAPGYWSPSDRSGFDPAAIRLCWPWRAYARPRA